MRTITVQLIYTPQLLASTTKIYILHIVYGNIIFDILGPIAFKEYNIYWVYVTFVFLVFMLFFFVFTCRQLTNFDILEPRTFKKYGICMAFMVNILSINFLHASTEKISIPSFRIGRCNGFHCTLACLSVKMFW